MEEEHLQLKESLRIAEKMADEFKRGVIEESSQNQREVLSEIKESQENKRRAASKLVAKDFKAFMTGKQSQEPNDKLKGTLSQAIYEVLFEVPKSDSSGSRTSLLSKSQFEKMRKTISEKSFVAIDQRQLGLVESINAFSWKLEGLFPQNKSMKHLLIVFQSIEETFYLNQKLSVFDEQASDVL